MSVERDPSNPVSEAVRPVNDADVSLDEMLSLAIRQGKQEIAELLMESGALVSRRNKAGNTPLLEACSNGYVQIASLLIDRGADIDAATETTHDSALTWASTLGNESIVRLLLERHANVEHRTKDGCTALMFAALAGHVKVTEMLLNYNAKLNVHSESNMDSPLTFACWKGHVEVVDLLLNRGADLEHRTKEGFTPLMFAALGGHTAVADCLLKRNAKVNVPSGSNNDIPLTSACWKGHHDVVELLLKYGSDLEHRTKDGCTPLMLAAREGHLAVAILILKHGGKVNTPSGSENNIPLTLACWKGHVEVVKLLLDASSLIEHRNKAGCTPLMLAAREGHLETTRLLLDRGAQLDEPSGSNDDTPLTLACWKGHAAVVDLLLQRKSNADHQTKTGCTPLMESTREGHVDVAEILLNYGADVETPDNYGQSPLFMACWKGHTDVADLLLQHNANKDCRTKTGITPLFQACRENHVGIVRLLLDHGCSVNAGFPNSRENPLTLAAEKGCIKLVSLLLNRGANVEARTKKGCSPFLLGCKEGHKEIVQLMAERGADLEALDQRNTTPLLAAFKNGHIEIVEWLLKRISHYPSEDECQKALVAHCPADKDQQELLALRTKCNELIVKARTQKKEAADRNALELCEELAAEKEKEEGRKAKKRDKRKRKQKEKKAKLQTMLQEEKERLQQEEMEKQKRREEKERLASRQLKVEQADEEDQTGRNQVAKLPDEESPSPSVMSDASGQKDSMTDEAAVSQPMATGPQFAQARNSGKRRKKQHSVKKTEELKPNFPSHTTSKSSLPPNSFHNNRSSSPSLSPSNLVAYQQSGTSAASKAKSLVEDGAGEPVPCARAKRDDCSSTSTSTLRHLDHSQARQQSLSPIERSGSPPLKASPGQDSRTDSGPPELCEDLLRRYQTDDEKLCSQEGKAADVSSLKSQYKMVVVTSMPATTTITTMSSVTTMSTVTASSSHPPLAATGSGDGRQHGGPWQEVLPNSSSFGRVVPMTVPNTLVGRIFGIQGSKINNICVVSAAQITISKDTNENGDRTVIIKGTPKAIEKARQMIDDALSRTDNFNLPSSLRMKSPLHAQNFDDSADSSAAVTGRRSSHQPARKIVPLGDDKKSVSVPAFKFSAESQSQTSADTPGDKKKIRDYFSTVVSRECGQILHSTSEPQFPDIPPLNSQSHLPLTAVASAPLTAVNTRGQASNANGDTLTSDPPKHSKTVRTFSAPPSTVASHLQMNTSSPYGNSRMSPTSSLPSSSSGSSSALHAGEEDMRQTGSPFTTMPFGPAGPVGGYGAIGSNKKNVVQTPSFTSSGAGDTEEVPSAATQAPASTYCGVEPLPLFTDTVWSAHPMPPSGPGGLHMGPALDERTHATDTRKPQYEKQAEELLGSNWAQGGGGGMSQWSGMAPNESREPVGPGFPYGGGHMKLSQVESWPRYQTTAGHNFVPQRSENAHEEDRHYSASQNVWPHARESDGHRVLGRSHTYHTPAFDHPSETQWPFPVGDPREHPSYPSSALPHRQGDYQPPYAKPIPSYGSSEGSGPLSRPSFGGLARLQKQERLVREMLDRSSISSFNDLEHLLTSWGLEDHHIQLLMDRKVTLPMLLEMPEEEIDRLGLNKGPHVKLRNGLSRLKGPSLPLDLRGDYPTPRVYPTSRVHPTPHVHTSVPQPQPRFPEHRVNPVPPGPRFRPRCDLPRALRDVAPAPLPIQMGGHAYYPVSCSGATVYVYDPYYSHQR